MEILFLCQRVPHPPDRGDRITTSRVLAMLRGLGRVRVGCFLERERDRAGVAWLEGEGVETAASPLPSRLVALPWLLTKRPLTLPCFRSRRLARRVEGWRREGLDLVFCYSSSMGQYALGPAWTGVRRVMQFAELDSDKWRQLGASSPFPLSWIYRREARRLLPFEGELARVFDLSLVVSRAERELFRRAIPEADPLVVENGVDTETFAPAPDPPREEAVVFTGVMSYQPNVKGVLRFVRECWPRVRRARPAARLFVVGSDPVKRIQKLDGREGITVTGRVPRTQLWFDRATAAVAPLWIARGIQNKVLEAMSMGLPVVATPAAFAGIDAEPGRHLLVAEEPAAFADRVVDLLADREGAARLGAAARRRVEERYDWAKLLAPLRRRLAGG